MLIVASNQTYFFIFYHFGANGWISFSSSVCDLMLKLYLVGEKQSGRASAPVYLAPLPLASDELLFKHCHGLCFSEVSPPDPLRRPLCLHRDRLIPSAA